MISQSMYLQENLRTQKEYTEKLLSGDMNKINPGTKQGNYGPTIMKNEVTYVMSH